MNLDIFSSRTALLSASSSVPSDQDQDHGIMDICFFLGKQRSLRIFTTTSFTPADTRFNIGEGSTYRVDVSNLHGNQSRLVAVKNLKPTNVRLRTVLQELRIQTHESLRQCQNIVTLEGYGWDVEQNQMSPYLVMEYSPFGTLKEFLSSGKVKVSFQEKLGYCQNVAKGLEALHACSIVHGDVKIENTLVFAKPGANGYIVKLSDFGHALVDYSSRYLGTELLNAPEVRKRELAGVESLTPYLKCDIFSYGLLVWETLQDGQRYRKFGKVEDPVEWLNGLPKDELLRLALGKLYCMDLTTMTVALRIVFQNVLGATLRDDPGDRALVQEIVGLYKSAMGTETPEAAAKEVPVFHPKPLENLDSVMWEGRFVRNFRHLPFAAQEQIVQQLESVASNENDPQAAASASYNLSICYEFGLGVEANTEKMLNLLGRAALGGVTQAAALYLRLHSAFGRPMLPSPQIGNVAYFAEVELQKVPNEKYFPARIREYEKSLQRAILRSPLDIYSGSSMIGQQVEFGQLERIKELIGSHLADFSEWKIIVHACEEHRGFGSSLLHYAARLGHLPLLQILLEEGANVNYCTKDGRTPLASACMGGHLHIVEFLLQNGASAIRKTLPEIPLLHWVIMFEEKEQQKAFTALADIGANIDGVVRSGGLYLPEHSLLLHGTPIATAIATRNYNLCKILIKAGAECEEFDAGNFTPLDVAVFSYIPELTRLLLDHLGDRRQKISPLFGLGLLPSSFLCLLHGDSIRQALEETVDIVLAAGFDINAEDEDGWTPLAHAISQFTGNISSYDLLEALISKGGVLTFDHQDRVVQLIGNVPKRSQKVLTRFLIEKKVCEVMPCGLSLLHAAAIRGNSEIIETILDLGVDVNQLQCEEEGSFMNALHCAVLLKGNAPVVRLLVERGADVNAISSEGYTALETAAMIPIADGEIIDVLINSGSQLEFLHEGKRTTILHHAASLSSRVDGRHIVFRLLRHANVRQQCDSTIGDKFTPLQVAASYGKLEVIEALIDVGANSDPDDSMSAQKIVLELGRIPRDNLNPDELYSHRVMAEKILTVLVDKQDLAHGFTPLHIAASLGNYRRVVELVEAGADVWMGNAARETALGSTMKALAGISGRVNDPDEDHRKAARSVIESLSQIDKYLQEMMLEETGKRLEVHRNTTCWDYPERAQVEKMSSVESKIRHLGASHPETLEEMSLLAKTYAHQDLWEEAEKWQEIVIAQRREQLREDHPDLLNAQSEILRTWIELGKLDEAKDLARHLADVALQAGFGDSVVLHRVLDISIVERVLGHLNLSSLMQQSVDTDEAPQHLRILAQIQLGITYCKLGRWKDCEVLRRSVLSELKDMAWRMEDLSDVISALGGLASEYEIEQRWHDAEPIRTLAYDQVRQIFGDNSHHSQKALSALIQNLRTQKKLDGAVELQLQLLELTEKRFSDELHPQPLRESSLLGILYGYQCRWLESEVLLTRVVERMKIVLGQHHRETLAAMINLITALGSQGIWDRAELIAEECVMLCREAARDEEFEIQVKALQLLVTVKFAQQKFEEAEELVPEVIEGFRTLFEEDHEQTIESTLLLGLIHYKRGHLEKSEEVYLRVLDKQKRLLGENHQDTINTMGRLAAIYNDLDRHEEAEETYRNFYNSRKTAFGETHPDTLTALLIFGQFYNEREKFDEAEKLFLPVIANLEELGGEKNEIFLGVMDLFAEGLLSQERWDETEKTYTKILEYSQATLGNGHDISRNAMFGLVITYSEQGRWREARKVSMELLSLETKVAGGNNPSMIPILTQLSNSSYQLRYWQDVEKYERQAWGYKKTSIGDDHPDTISSMEVLLDVSTKLELWDKVRPLRVKMLDFKRNSLGEDHPDTISALEDLSSVCILLKDWREVRQISCQLLEFYNRNDDEEQALVAKSTLAFAYRNQLRLEKAEELQLQVAESNRIKFGENDLNTLKALAALAQTYRAQVHLPEAESIERKVLEERKKQLGDLEVSTIEAMANLSETLILQGCWHEADNLLSIVTEQWKSVYGQASSQFVAVLKAKEKVCLGLGKEAEAEELRKKADMRQFQIRLNLYTRGQPIDVSQYRPLLLKKNVKVKKQCMPEALRTFLLSFLVLAIFGYILWVKCS